jgi:hypothetical protein
MEVRKAERTYIRSDKGCNCCTQQTGMHIHWLWKHCLSIHPRGRGHLYTYVRPSLPPCHTLPHGACPAEPVRTSEQQPKRGILTTPITIKSGSESKLEMLRNLYVTKAASKAASTLRPVPLSTSSISTQGGSRRKGGSNCQAASTNR